MQSSLKSFFKAKDANTEPATAVSANQRPVKRKLDSVDPEPSVQQEAKRFRKFLPQWKKAYSWLQHDEEEDKMWCDVCREYCRTTKVGPINAFVEGTNYFKVDRVKQHDSSNFHKDSLLTKAGKLDPNTTPLGKIKIKLDEQQREKYSKLFSTAFTIAKHDMSFRNFEVLCKLQLKNNLDIGQNYQNTHACAMFIGSIAATQREAASTAILKSRFIAVLGDGSTDRSVAEQEAVFIRYLSAGTPVTRFVALVELDDGTADRVFKGINDGLDLVGVDMKTQKAKVVNINIDGASVNMGKYNGVAVKVQTRLGSHVTKVHCIKHQLELAILDIRKYHPYLGIFETTVRVSFYIVIFNFIMIFNVL